MRAIREHIKTKTVLFVSHDTNIVLELCTRAFLLEQGSIVMDGSPKDVLDYYQQDLMGCKPVNVVPDSHSEIETPDQPGDGSNSLSGEHSVGGIGKSIDVGDFRQADRISSQCGNAIYFKNNLFGSPPSSALPENILVFEEAFLRDGNGQRIMGTSGGELVSVNLRYRFLSDTDNAYVGFAVRDYKGQYIFGDNTFYLGKERSLRFARDGVYTASFVFRMPYLLQGTYVLVAVAASGSPDDFTILSWVNEAGLFDSRNSDNFQGLVGIPMLDITVQREF
jgi:lipopolysaccharide transport system ATP-binding protein